MLVDSAGLTLLAYGNFGVSSLGVPANRFAARWLDASGSPVTGWFDGGPLSTGFLLQPLLGGGAALSTDGSSWSFFPSGKSQAENAPAVLHSTFPVLGDAHGQFARILGGKAYAVQSGSGWKVIAPTGEVCGQLPPLADAGSTFAYAGRDGTLIGLSGPNRCTVSYYPGLLK